MPPKKYEIEIHKHIFEQNMSKTWTDQEKEIFLNRFRDYKCVYDGRTLIEVSGIFNAEGPVYILDWKFNYDNLITIIRVGGSWKQFNSNKAYANLPLGVGTRYAPTVRPRAGKEMNRYFKKINFLYEYPDSSGLKEKSVMSFIKFIMLIPRNILPREMIEHIISFMRRIDMFTYGMTPITR